MNLKNVLKEYEMLGKKTPVMNTILVLLLITFTACSSGLVSTRTDNNPELTVKGGSLSDDELMLYMGYNAALYGGDLNKAQFFLEQLVEAKPDNLEFVSDLIGLYVYRKNIDKALSLIDKALVLDPYNVRILSSLSDIYVMKGDKKSAIATLEKVLSLDKNRDNIPLVLANLYFQEKEFQKAATLLEEYVKAKPENFLAHIYLGRVYEELGKNGEAAREYELALAEREEDEILITLDNIYDKLGEKEKSIEVLERFLNKNPDYPKVRERVALLYLAINNYEKALVNYEQLLKQYPDNKELMFKYILIAIDGGFYEKAKVSLEDLLNKDPNNQKGLYFMGLLYKETKEWGKAIDFLEKVTDKGYEKSAKMYLSVCYEKIGQSDKAFIVLKDYWEKEHDGEIGYYLALYYKNKRDYDNAYKLLEELLKDTDNSNKIILLMAEIHLKRNEFEKGISLVKGLLDKSPDNPDALNFIGYSYVERGVNLEEAEVMIQKALNLKPDDPFIMDSLAWLYYMKKDYHKALEIQKKVVLKIKDDATILEHMGDILSILGEKKAAREYYKKALENEPENIELLKKKIEELKDF